MNKKSILKKIFNLISPIQNSIISLYIEEIFENQIELHLNNTIIKKSNKNIGVRIMSINNNETKYDSIICNNYYDLFDKIKKYLFDNFNINGEIKENDILIKKFNNKKKYYSKQKKYRIMRNIVKKNIEFNSFKVSFYEKKDTIYFIKNTNRFIYNSNNLYTKIMLKGIINDNKIFDFIMSCDGYKNINEKRINNLVERFNEIRRIKTNGINISNGYYDLVLSNNCGTVFHEMFGHNLEIDLIKKCDIESFKVNYNLNNNLITYIDNPHLKEFFNINFDDMFNCTNKKILIKEGIINNYITTLRSENFSYVPSSRMSNSYLKPNKKSLPFDLSKVDSAIYVYKISYGRLYVEKQLFEFTIDAGYLIKDGCKVDNVSNIKILVKVSDFIKKITYIGNDLNFVPTICGAQSGNIFVYAGCPTVYVEKIYINQ